MEIKGYGILNKKESLKLLCIRGGFSLNNLISSEQLSGDKISEKLKSELGLDSFHLKLSPEKSYTLCSVSLEENNSFFQKVVNFFRGSIGGTLVIARAA